MGHKVEFVNCTYFWNTAFPFRFLYTLPSFCVGRQSSCCVTWRSVHRKFCARTYGCSRWKCRTRIVEVRVMKYLKTVTRTISLMCCIKGIFREIATCLWMCRFMFVTSLYLP